MVDCGSIALCIVTFRDLERANNKTNEKHCEKSLVDVKCPTRFLKQTTKMWKKVGDGTNYVGMVFLENLINPNPTKILQKYTSKSSKHKNCDKKWGKGQILLEWFSKYIKQKREKR